MFIKTAPNIIVFPLVPRNVQKKGGTMPNIEISNMKKLEKSMTISVVHGNLRFKVKSEKFGAIA